MRTGDGDVTRRRINRVLVGFFDIIIIIITFKNSEISICIVFIFCCCQISEFSFSDYYFRNIFLIFRNLRIQTLISGF